MSDQLMALPCTSASPGRRCRCPSRTAWTSVAELFQLRCATAPVVVALEPILLHLPV